MGENVPGGVVEILDNLAKGNLKDNPQKNRTPLQKKPHLQSIVNEVQVVELQNGTIRCNARTSGNEVLRKTALSKDGGQTWSAIESVAELRDPHCMASIFRFSDSVDPQNGDQKIRSNHLQPKKNKSRILYSGPQSNRREKGTIFLSYDEAKTWPIHRLLRKDSFAYSCLTALQDGQIGCLFEADSMQKIVFARFSLDWLTEGKDKNE